MPRQPVVSAAIANANDKAEIVATKRNAFVLVGWTCSIFMESFILIIRFLSVHYTHGLGTRHARLGSLTHLRDRAYVFPVSARKMRIYKRPQIGQSVRI